MYYTTFNLLIIYLVNFAYKKKRSCKAPIVLF
nr:MAG TPA: hypothetical protein [Caudoviricetes sp.]